MPPTPRHLAACAVLPVLFLCGGCSGGETAAPQPSGAAASAPVAPTASPAARPGSFDEIAAVLGCTPEVTVDAEEIREGACGTGPQAYRMATFTTEEGRSAWLAESRVYGGTYLVGPRWVVTAATPEALGPLHDRLGGTVESGSTHGSAHGSADGSGGSPVPGSAPHAGHPSP
ncbi:hypothetical protein ACFVGY_02490 [Streptomyces sp. NPDC127106]|uniref:hypothetical protein n=1 Tax=Streptomyces sp. NPDC127106 TaxID=3345360 RepID=UPI00363EEACB